MRLWLTAILFAILFTVGVMVRPYFRGPVDLSERGNLGQQTFYGEHNVQGIEIDSGDTHIAMERERKNNWRMVRPFIWPVNPFAVRRFFQIFEENPDLPPGVRIILHGKDSGEKVFEGSRGMANALRSQELDEIIRGGESYWCQRKIFPFNGDAIGSIEFTFHGTQRHFLLSKNNGHWTFTQPVEIEADEISLQEFLQWITHLEVLPMGEDRFFDQYLYGTGERPLDGDVFRKTPHVTLRVMDDQRREKSVTCGRFSKEGTGETVQYGCLDDGGALFTMPWNGVLDHPLRSLCTRSLFPEIKSLTLSHGKQKLFLSCNESGQWSSFKFSQGAQVLQSLENFDTSALLHFFSSLELLDVVPAVEILDSTPREKFSLEINALSRFEILAVGNRVYLIPAKRHYAVIIAEGFLEKLLDIMREISQENSDSGPKN